MAAAVVMVGVGDVGVKSTTVAVVRWAVPLASAPSRSDRLARVCGGTVDTVNVGFHAPSCPPLLILRYVRGGPLPYKASAPDQGADWIDFPIPEIFSKGKEITFLTFSPLISISHLNSTIHLFTNQCTWHTAS
jgi:hypothetical protein